MAATDRDRLLRVARRRGALSSREAAELGIHSQQLSRLVAEGRLQRINRGQYRWPDYPVTEHHSLAVTAKALPNAVICLLSALSFHGIGTQLPADVWVAIDRRSRRPRLAYPRLRVMRFGGPALTAGVEEHRIEGQLVKIYGVAKTLADVFKYRNKVGLDVALEALREAWRARRFTMDELDRYARICRVHRVMGPYLELLVS
jgi:predicted transcriptional regulator of viral defense system